MSEVIHRVGFPGGAGAMMRYVDHAVDDRVAEVHVGGGHVDFGTQHHLPLRYLTAVHLLEELERLLNRTVAKGTVGAGNGRCTLLAGDLLSRLFIDICLTFPDQFQGEVPQLLEIVGRIVDVPPLVTQPFDILQDGVNIFHILLHRVGVIEAEVADTAIFLCNPEIDADGLGMAYVQVTVRLGREAGLYASVVTPCCQVFLYHCFDKIEALPVLLNGIVFFYIHTIWIIVLFAVIKWRLSRKEPPPVRRTRHGDTCSNP